MPFPGLWGRFNRILIVRKSVLVCRNLQFSSTKWPKAYLINYYMLNKLQESVGNTIMARNPIQYGGKACVQSAN